MREIRVSLSNKTIISKYIRHHKPVVMREMGISEKEYEKIYHVKKVEETLNLFDYSRSSIHQALYCIMDAVKSDDPKVKNGCVLISRLYNKCVIRGCKNDGEYASVESTTENNLFKCLALVDDEGNIRPRDYTNKLKMVFLCGEHADLNKKGLGYVDILIMVNRDRKNYYFVELF